MRIPYNDDEVKELVGGLSQMQSQLGVIVA